MPDTSRRPCLPIFFSRHCDGREREQSEKGSHGARLTAENRTDNLENALSGSPWMFVHFFPRVATGRPRSSASPPGTGASSRGERRGEFFVEGEKVLHAVAVAGESFAAVAPINSFIERGVGCSEGGRHGQRVVKVGEGWRRGRRARAGRRLPRRCAARAWGLRATGSCYRRCLWSSCSRSSSAHRPAASMPCASRRKECRNGRAWHPAGIGSCCCK